MMQTGYRAFSKQEISETESRCETKLNNLIWYYCAEGKLPEDQNISMHKKYLYLLITDILYTLYHSS